MRNPQKKLSPNETEELIGILKARFEKHMNRHKGIAWDKVQARLEELSSAPAARAGKLWSLHQMEATGGEPDVVGYDKNKDLFLFVDCSAESPKGRRSLCYDRDALDARKEYKPRDSAVDMAAAMGITLLTEDDYRQLQRLGEFDLKTSSWVLTPAPVRTRGGAVFCDRRYDQVFLYHNGADSYYAARGFRGKIEL